MSKELIGLVCLGIMLIGVYSGIKIGYIMTLSALLGITLISSFKVGINVMALMPWNAISNNSFAAMAFFTLAGEIIYRAGMGSDLFVAAERWLGRVRGGLAVATATASAILGFITSSTVANMAMGKIAIPEMRKAKYSDSVASGAVAGGAAMASIVPPSGGFILYAMLTGESLGKLYLAALIPALVLYIFMVLGILGQSVTKKDEIPISDSRYALRDKVSSLKLIWPILFVVVLSLVGIYRGFMTATEAGAVVCVVCLIIAFIGKRLTLKVLRQILIEQAEMLGMVAFLLTNSYVFQRLITLSDLANALTAFIQGANIAPILVMVLVCAVFILMGMFSDIFACLMIALPILYPVVTSLGYNGIWFGVLCVVLAEMGLISPPFGLNVFTLSGVAEIPATKIFKGIWVYIVSLVLLVIVLLAYPRIVTMVL